MDGVCVGNEGQEENKWTRGVHCRAEWKYLFPFARQAAETGFAVLSRGTRPAKTPCLYRVSNLIALRNEIAFKTIQVAVYGRFEPAWDCKVVQQTSKMKYSFLNIHSLPWKSFHERNCNQLHTIIKTPKAMQFAMQFAFYIP